MENLNKIKRRYNIEIDDEFFNSDQQLFKSFMSMNPNAFFSFKNHANISRTLAKNHFKPKVKTGIEKRKEEVIRLYDQERENLKRIKMYQDDLIVLKPVNKERYRLEKRRLNQIIQCRKQGTKTQRITEMLDELPETFKPDEEDIMLAETLKKHQEQADAARKERIMTTESSLQKNDSIMSLSPINENLNNSQQLINVTDFGGSMNSTNDQQTNVAIKNLQSVPDSGSQQDCSQLLNYGTATPAERHNTTSPNKKNLQQKTIKDIKLADMHMKRRVPQLYLSKDVRDGFEGKMNDFNS